MNASAKTAVVLSTLFISFGFSTPALAATVISDDIEGDTTWTLSESPYLITESINFSAITPGATLTIEPGVMVEMEPNTTFNIFGDLLATGTQNQNIIFKSTEINGNWQINIHNSLNSGLSYISLESIQGTFASHNSVVSITQMTSNSKLTFYSGVTTNIHNLNLINNQLYIEGGTTLVNQLNIHGGNSNFHENSITLRNATIDETNGSPAILIANSAANLENISINNASHGIIASNVSSLSIYNTTIKNIAEDGIIFSGGIAKLNGVTIENAYYGAGLQGDVIGLTNFHVRDTQSSSVQTDANETTVIDSSFSNGPNTGLTINGGIANLQSVTIKNFANAPAFLPNVENLQGNRLIITDNLFGVYNYGSSTIRQSKITNNIVAGALNAGGFLDVRENYWGHAGGPTINPTNPDSIKLGDGIMGDVLYEPWLAEYCEVNCYSNIMFLPGIMASRIYENDEQIWEPNIFTDDSEFEKLYLNESGKSINPNIVTRDVIDNGYAYGKFVEDLVNLKVQGVINGYEAVPYDWRLSMEDVLNSGTKQGDGSIIYGSTTSKPYIEETLRQLAANSKSGKVTIVAHSNGGLVTKALINKLGTEASKLIDKIIFVGVPQLGTPQAIGALLHGYESGQPAPLPFILSEERARDLAINMPMIYQLLPFSDYYNGDGQTVNIPYVTFEDGEHTQAFIDQYGYAITPGELFDFLTGAEGRIPATFDDLENPIKANTALLSNAIDMQQEINSSWQPPAGIEMHQIAGIGENTLSSITYMTVENCLEYDIHFKCINYEKSLSYKPYETLDGDGTVVVPSALAISDTNQNVERWWINLKDYNDTILNSATFDLLSSKHSNILEIEELRDFIFNNLLKDDLTSTPNFISSTQPELSPEKRLMFTLHSPLLLSAVDENGNVVSYQEATIPGANYTRYGEVQVITIPTGTKFTIVLTGEAEGSFTLEMEEFDDDNEIMASSTFFAIPSSTSTIATITFEDGTIEEAGVLQIDHDGDLIVDVTYTPILNEEVSTPDPLPEENTEIIETVSTGGLLKPTPKVLGANTDIEHLVEIIAQLQTAVTTLDLLRKQITEEQYGVIHNQLKHMLDTVIKSLEYESKKSV